MRFTIVGCQVIVFAIEGKLAIGNTVAITANQCAKIWRLCKIPAKAIEPQHNI